MPRCLVELYSGCFGGDVFLDVINASIGDLSVKQILLPVWVGLTRSAEGQPGTKTGFPRNRRELCQHSAFGFCRSPQVASLQTNPPHPAPLDFWIC